MRNLNFKTKEEYLAYRVQWKADYQELTQDIRNLKWLRATRCRAYSKVIKDLRRPDGEYYRKLVAGVKKYLNDIPQYGKLIKKYFGDKPYWIEGRLQDKRIEATCMLGELKQAKIESNEMRQKLLVVA
jgi:hypothetical protein